MNRMARLQWPVLWLGVWGVLGIAPQAGMTQQPLANTQPLVQAGDLAVQMVEGIDRFLLQETEAEAERRAARWQRDLTSVDSYLASVETQRERLAKILGVVDPRVPSSTPELLGTVDQSAVVGRGKNYEIWAVRWSALDRVHGEGLLLVPVGAAPRANVIAIPDCEQSPEQLVGLGEGLPPASQYARRLAESGCRVLVPLLIDRTRGGYAGVRLHQLTNREFLYRSAFELGRHLIGYELQKILAGVDWLARDAAETPIGVMGYGEGGMLALYAGALDQRINVTVVSGYFDSRQALWQEPLDRNVFGLLRLFDSAELATLIVPRQLIVEAAEVPRVEIPPGTGGGPGHTHTPELPRVRAEVERANNLVRGLTEAETIQLIADGDNLVPVGNEATLQSLLSALEADWALATLGERPQSQRGEFEPRSRMHRQIQELDRYSQALLAESPYTRQKFMAGVDTSSREAFASTIEPLREYFRDEVVGRFDQPLSRPNPRSRQVYHDEDFTGYEVTLDVFPDVFAYGILLLPKSIEPGKRRPVVVCQHGLEGRPQDVADPTVDNPAYSQFAVQLARRGFITFSPQNPYIGQDRFRTLQRKANPLGKTLFSIIVPQHQQIVDWLATLPQVDPDRIAFYGLSYGGKTAMRVPPLVAGYCLSICSADFNDWVWKNASTRSPYSYVWTGEYEIFEFDLGSTFNYAEMAALIAPRPFMVERGHFDGVAPDERVAYEFAKVRHLYSAQLGLEDRCELEWFVGPHSIHGVGTFAFLHRHLEWPDPQTP